MSMRMSTNSRVRYSPKVHVLYNTVSCLKKNENHNSDNQEITLLNTNLDEDISTSNDLQLRFQDDDVERLEPKRRMRKICYYILFIAVFIMTFLFIIYFSVKGKLFYKFTVIRNNGIKLTFDHSTNAAIIQGNVDDKDYISINFGKHSIHDFQYKDSKDCATDSRHEICLEWNNAKLQIQPVNLDEETSCFSVVWLSSDLVSPKDCVDIKYDGTDIVWFDAYNYKMWPKDNKSYLEFYHKFLSNQTDAECENSSLSYVPGAVDSKTAIPLEKMGGTIIEPMWINSNGVLIKMSMQDQISVDTHICKHGESSLCLGTQFDAHQTYHSRDRTSTLKYEICINPDINRLHDNFLQMVKSNLSKPIINYNISYESGDVAEIKTQAMPESCMNFMNTPLWNIVIKDDYYTTSKMRQEFADIEDIGGVALLDVVTELSTKIGDYGVVNDNRNLVQYINILHMLNFSVVLPVTPFVHYSSNNLEQRNDYFVKDSDGSNILVDVKEGGISRYVTIVDPTNPKAVSWYEAKVKKFLSATKAEYLYFSHGQASWLPSNHKLHKPLHNQAHYSTLYAQIASKISKCAVTDTAFSTQRLNQIIMLSAVQDMRSTLKEALSAGLAGYPFFIANLPSPLDEAAKHLSAGLLEDGFIRWLQMVTFFPIMHIPWDYQTLHNEGINIPELSKAIKHFISLRNKQQVKVAFENAISDAIAFGKPIVKPMWMAPNQAINRTLMMSVYNITDQFMVGDSLLVAPKFDFNHETRHIYFPPGHWIDIMNGAHIISKTGMWEINYPSTVMHIPVFYRREDDI